ncbi:hypothetical protein COLO4_14452 [Corchorus olitorius]|uniref:Uncharacterized protein n=1 Tax=Corchorus olitorius TaxID=93759 RepID=A0A1R3JS19_9ROSI|nr:hypothetical protein COLO4_14452 [Corchorus olitorius]
MSLDVLRSFSRLTHQHVYRGLHQPGETHFFFSHSWSSGSGGIGGSTTQEGQETGGCRLLLIQEEILWGPEGTMSTDESKSNHESGNKKRSNGGEEDNEDAKEDEDAKSLAVGESAAEDDKRLISRAEEIEKDPRAAKAQKEEKREGMGEKREGENETNHSQIIDFEIRIVLADTEGSLGERLGLGKGGTVNKFSPGTALREGIADGIIEVGNESANCGGSGRWLGFGGLGGGDGEDGWSCRRHCCFDRSFFCRI